MQAKAILDEALHLKQQDRFMLIEGLLSSLDNPDKDIDQIWAVEADKRLQAYRARKLEGIPFEEVFKND